MQPFPSTLLTKTKMHSWELLVVLGNSTQQRHLAALAILEFKASVRSKKAAHRLFQRIRVLWPKLRKTNERHPKIQVSVLPSFLTEVYNLAVKVSLSFAAKTLARSSRTRTSLKRHSNGTRTTSLSIGTLNCRSPKTP